MMRKREINQEGKSYVAQYLDIDEQCIACRSKLIIGLLFEVFKDENGEEVMELRKSVAGCKTCGLTYWVVRLEDDGGVSL